MQGRAFALVHGAPEKRHDGLLMLLLLRAVCPRDDTGFCKGGRP
jgi:hypothetical protein